MGEIKPKSSAGESQLAIKKQLSYSEIEQIGRAFVASGMFGRDVNKISKAITKIMAGQELGLAPFASMRAVHVIEGNATLSANTMAGMIKSSGRYDYSVVKKEATSCVIDFYETIKGKRTKIGTESFDEDEAKSAGLLNKQNWQKYPKAMMFARCISNGVRTYCPDVFSGMLVYTPDELNARVSVEGEVIDVSTTEDKLPPKQAEKAPDELKDSPLSEAVNDADFSGEPDIDGEMPEDFLVDEPTADEPSPSKGLAAAVVDDEFKDMTWKMFEELPLIGAYKIRFLKDVTGKMSRNTMTEDNQWLVLYERVSDIASGDTPLPAEYIEKAKA